MLTPGEGSSFQVVPTATEVLKHLPCSNACMVGVECIAVRSAKQSDGTAASGNNFVSCTMQLGGMGVTDNSFIVNTIRSGLAEASVKNVVPFPMQRCWFKSKEAEASDDFNTSHAKWVG